MFGVAHMNAPSNLILLSIINVNQIVLYVALWYNFNMLWTLYVFFFFYCYRVFSLGNVNVRRVH